MTHDELLAMIDKQDHAIQIGGIGSEIEVLRLMGFRNALRAVVELHKPVMAFTGGYDGLDNELWAEQCNDCSNNGFSQAYACPTIQAIEKELK